MRVFATGFDEYIEDDTPAIYASTGRGNTEDELEIFLEFVDPPQDVAAGAWFRVSDIQSLLNAAIHPPKRVEDL